jgi:hypothetical protein
MLLCFQIRVNFTLVLCIACYHFEFGIADPWIARVIICPFWTVARDSEKTLIHQFCKGAIVKIRFGQIGKKIKLFRHYTMLASEFGDVLILLAMFTLRD